MTDRVIKLLRPSDFGSFKGWVTDAGNLNPVFVASFKHPNEKKPIDMYVKLYSMQVGERAVFNEIAGYLMANALKLPQPKHACMALLPTATLRQNQLASQVEATLLKEIMQEAVFPAFCTAKIDKSETALVYHKTYDAIMQEMINWRPLAQAIAMDNTIAHIDRHTRNILRTGKNQYHLIDNGTLVKFEAWQREDLQQNTHFTNKLLKLAELTLASSKLTTVKQKASLATNNHPKALASIIDELNYWSQVLYSSHQSDYNAFIQFLDARADEATALFAARLQMLL